MAVNGIFGHRLRSYQMSYWTSNSLYIYKKTSKNIFFKTLFLLHQAIHKWSLNMDWQVFVTKTVAYISWKDRHINRQTDTQPDEQKVSKNWRTYHGSCLMIYSTFGLQSLAAQSGCHDNARKWLTSKRIIYWKQRTIYYLIYYMT